MKKFFTSAIVVAAVLFTGCNEDKKESIKNDTKTQAIKDSKSVDVVGFLEKSFQQNPNISKLNVSVVEKVKLEKLDGWNAYIVRLEATLKNNREVKQKMIWFANATTITQDLVDMESGLSYKESITPTFKDEYYKKENLIYGNENAKHKVAIFSDPLCPFCQRFVPQAIEKMKTQPEKFAVYYYHFPLENLHPAAVALTKAAVAAELQGHKDVVLKMYQAKVGGREGDVEKILAELNKVVGSNVKVSDLNDPRVLQHYNHDMRVADELMVAGTPTLFFDGEIDKAKTKFEEVQ